MHLSLYELFQTGYKRLQTQEMCAKAARKNSYLLQYVPNCFKTKEMCSEALHKEPYLLHLTLRS